MKDSSAVPEGTNPADTFISGFCETTNAIVKAARLWYLVLAALANE